MWLRWLFWILTTSSGFQIIVIRSVWLRISPWEVSELASVTHSMYLRFGRSGVVSLAATVVALAATIHDDNIRQLRRDEKHGSLGISDHVYTSNWKAITSVIVALRRCRTARCLFNYPASGREKVIVLHELLPYCHYAKPEIASVIALRS